MANKFTQKKADDTQNILERIERKLDALRSNNFTGKDYLTTKEACSFLGISRVRLWQMVEAKQVNKYKLNDSTRNAYKKSELELMFSGQTA
jgi:hypothetical protein